MGGLSGTPTINQKSREVQRHLLDLTSLLNGQHRDAGVPASAVTDAFERFTLWAGNLGAMRAPSARMSLDFRLAEAEDIRDQICQQLDELVEATEDLTNIVRGTTPNRHVGLEDDIVVAELEDIADGDYGDVTPIQDAPSSEAHMIVLVMSECITSLFRLGMLVRKSTHRDRFKRALQATDYAFPAMFDVDYVRHKHPKIDHDWLVERLGSGIAKRRQFIKYSRDHRTRLGVEDDDVDLARGPGTGTERLSSKATTFLAARAAEVEDDAVSFMSASSMTESLASLKLPRLVDLSTDNEPFECPICFTLQSFKTDKSWQVHAYRDLRAYVCTAAHGECNDRFFGDRDSWFEHELKEHRARYKCSLCQHGPLPWKDMRKHIQAAHGPFPDDQLNMLHDAGREPVTKLLARDCPFCNDWSRGLSARANPRANPGPLGQGPPDILVSASRFKRHVATHQEQLAIFALPRAADEDGTPGSGSVAYSNSRGSSLAGSNDSDSFPRPTISPADAVFDPLPYLRHDPSAHFGGATANMDGSPDPGKDLTVAKEDDLVRNDSGQAVDPRYCYCNGTSNGEMIMCDGERCKREWFHLGCVGLKVAPEGDVEWYCEDCTRRLRLIATAELHALRRKRAAEESASADVGGPGDVGRTGPRREASEEIRSSIHDYLQTMWRRPHEQPASASLSQQPVDPPPTTDLVQSDERQAPLAHDYLQTMWRRPDEQPASASLSHQPVAPAESTVPTGRPAQSPHNTVADTGSRTPG